jgi:hypothetical protein
MEHSSFLTIQLEIRTRLRVSKRFFTIQRALATQPVVVKHSFLTQGFENTATGAVALQANTTGNDNTATGFAALNANTTGKLNTAVGVGCLASSPGDLNVALGFGAGANLATGNNNIDAGNIGVPTEDNVIRVGAQVAATDPFGVLHPAHTATYIAGIRDADAAGGDAVFVTTDGKLGTIQCPFCGAI